MTNNNDNHSRYETEEQKEIRKERDKLSKLAELQFVADCQVLLQTPEFRRVMGKIIEMGGLFHSPMTGNSHTFYKIGRQDFSREILAKLAAANKNVAFDLLKPQKIGESNG